MNIFFVQILNCEFMKMDSCLFNRIKFECVECTGSTNTDLLQRVKQEGLEKIVVRRALSQTNGRGTRGRTWDGGRNCLMFSVAIPIGKNLRVISAITLVIGANIVLALNKCGVEAKIKWPNDILLNGKKLAGILVEAAKAPTEDYVLVVGVGFNLRKNNNPTSYGSAGLSDVLGDDLLDENYWLKLLIESILKAADEIKSEGLTRVKALWDTIAAYKNQTVYIYEENHTVYEAEVIGIDDDGRLLVRCGSTEKALLSGTISIRLKNESTD